MGAAPRPNVVVLFTLSAAGLCRELKLKNAEGIMRMKNNLGR